VRVKDAIQDSHILSPAQDDADTIPVPRVACHAVAATRAWERIRKKSEAIYSILAKHDPSVEYFMEAGFNEEVIKNGGGLLEEIYIVTVQSIPGFLSLVEADQSLIKSLSEVVSPFPTYILQYDGSGSSIEVPVLDEIGQKLAWSEVVLQLTQPIDFIELAGQCLFSIPMTISINLSRRAYH
jgi:hypothetical protein